MAGRIFTIETRIQLNSDFTSYYVNFTVEYNRVYREMWHIIKNEDIQKPSHLITKMCNKHNLLKRTVNSIYHDVKGRLNSLKELKKTELAQLESKIEKTEEKVLERIETVESLKNKVVNNSATKKQLDTYRKAKRSLYYQKNKLNRLRQRKNTLQYQIEHAIYKIGFGGKRTFKKQYNLKENRFRSHEGWYNRYIRQRDKNVYYLGSKDEHCQNQMFQLGYDKESDDFTVQIRKEKKYSCDGKYLVLEHVDFKYMKENIIEILKDGQQPLSFRIHRKGKKWYLQCMFEIKVDTYDTSSVNGTIGLDYNDGFIELSETDRKGNLVYQKHYALKYHGTGNRAKNEIRTTVNEIVKMASAIGKNIVIEDLDFKRKKAKLSKAKRKKGKEYNRMLHKFDYSRYKETLKNCAHRNRVVLTMVNPAYTSQIGKQKYSFKKKLNIHQAASYVIARRGQGYTDKYIK